MAIAVTNRIAQSALRGESAGVSLNSTDQAQLPSILIGMTATLGSGAVGIVQRVDLFGTMFWIGPKATPAGNVASASTPGILNVGETVTLT